MQVPDIDRELLVKAAISHMHDLHSTIYGRLMYITKEEEYEKAAEWLVDQIEPVLKEATKLHYMAVGIDITKNGQDPRTDDRLT